MTANHRSLDESDIALIERVKQTPSLYDPRNPDFRIPFRKERNWSSLANSLGLTAADARRRFTCLRDRYSRELKQLRLNPDKGEFGKNDFFEKMDFLRKFVRKRKERRANTAYKYDSSNTTNSLDEATTKDATTAASANDLKLTTKMDDDDDDDFDEEDEQDAFTFEGKLDVPAEVMAPANTNEDEQEFHHYVANNPYEASVEDQSNCSSSVKSNNMCAMGHSVPQGSGIATSVTATTTRHHYDPSQMTVQQLQQPLRDPLATEVQQQQHVVTLGPSSHLHQHVATLGPPPQLQQQSQLPSQSQSLHCPMPEAKNNNVENEDDYFCKSVAAYLRQLSRRHKIKAKVEIFQILEKFIDIEENEKS